MNVTLSKDALAFLVQTASRPIPNRSTIPSIRGCLIEATSDRLTFSGTNLDWGVRVSVKADVKSMGSVVVSSRILEDVVRTITSPEVSLSLAESAWALEVNAGTTQMILNAVPADDFPKWPENTQGDKIIVNGGLFKEMTRVGATCAVTNPARPLWGACLLEFSNGNMAVVSTDQFALSRARKRVQSHDASAIISANVLSDIARLVDDNDEIEIKIADNHVYFATSSLSCFSRLIDGQYYDYEQVIPRNFACEVTVSTESLLRAASRAAIVASEEDRAMRMILNGSNGTLTVKAGSTEKGRMEEVIPAKIDGEDLEIWVQHKYILQALGKVSGDQVFLGISGPVSAMKIEPVIEEGQDSVEASFVIMPMSSPKGEF
jgi:DNA polymerase-3 subunit beta